MHGVLLGGHGGRYGNIGIKNPLTANPIIIIASRNFFNDLYDLLLDLKLYDNSISLSVKRG